MTTYFTYTGSPVQAVMFLCSNGGLLFRGRSPQHPSVVVLGSQVHTWWPPRSGMRVQLNELSQMLGYDPQHLTAGRLARKVLADLIGLDCKDTEPSPHYLRIARQGWHWHHLSCIPGYHECVGEFDLKSAYATSLLRGPSFLLHPKQGYLPDGGALDNLRNLLPVCPKWFRLVLLGVIASYEMNCFRVDLSKPDKPIVPMTVKKISYGYAFNAVQSAILRVFAFLDKIKNFGNDWIVRTHTDCFWLDYNAPTEVEQTIFNWVKDEGFEIVCKRFGPAILQDVNTGIIGGHRLGVPDRVKDLTRKWGEKANRVRTHTQYPDKWRGIPYVSPVPPTEANTSKSEFEPVQLSLMDVI